MGNDVSKNMANRMAIGAMSNVTDVEKAQLIKMCFNLKDIGKRQGNPNIVTKEEFHEAFQGVDVSQSDRDVFDRLFVMLDRTGEDRINHKEFMMGVCPFISGTTLAVLQLAFELYEDASDNIKYSDLRFILMTINTVASYFGDPVMRTDQVDELVTGAKGVVTGVRGAAPQQRAPSAKRPTATKRPAPAVAPALSARKHGNSSKG